MEERYSLLIQKGDGSVIDTFAEFGIVCCKVPFTVGCTVKQLPVRSWADENGEDVYVPLKTVFEAYDARFEFAYKGQELATNPFNLNLAFRYINAFKNWLTGNDTEEGSGAELKIYSPFSTIGRQGCYLKSISDEEPHVQTVGDSYNDYHENVVTFSVTFRVTDPVTNIVLVKSNG